LRIGASLEQSEQNSHETSAMGKPSRAPIWGSLCCEPCGRRTDCTEGELILYAQERWPECCNKTMLLVFKDDGAEWNPLRDFVASK
jgi:hypothetical protein